MEVAFLLNQATVLIIESASANLDVTPNDEAVRSMRAKTDRLLKSPSARIENPDDMHHHDYDFDEIR